MKRFGQLLTVALFATAVWTTSADAAPVFHNFCKVQIIGVPANGVVVMNITELSNPPAFVNKWFVGAVPTANQMLAIGLTAISVDKIVNCEVDAVPDPGVLIQLLMTNQDLP